LGYGGRVPDQRWVRELHGDDAPAIRVPTLALTGAKSPAVRVRLSERLLELLLDARRVVNPAASHVMHEENAPATNAAILAFLSERRAQTAA
jgi:pimeloyl-ACP methyl ester carboxylesterase